MQRVQDLQSAWINEIGSESEEISDAESSKDEAISAKKKKGAKKPPKMFDLFNNVKKFVQPRKVKIDDFVFQFHYQMTAGLLFLCSLLVTSRQYIGDPIDCMVDEIPGEVMDTFCWIYSTFTLPDKLKGRIGTDLIQPGVAPHVHGEDEVKYHKYYQWVCFVLFFQGVLFYIPHYIWKVWEGGRIKKLTTPLKEIYTKKKEQKSAIACVVKVVQFYRRSQEMYAYRYIFCEFLNVVNVIGQIVFMDYFLDWEFSQYGWDVFFLSNVNPDQRDDPMARVFPKITKCTFHKYGPSGTVQKFDGLCVLPVNILNEKIYAVIWLWFVILSIISVLYFLYRIATLTNKSLRKFLLTRAYSFADSSELMTVNDGCHFGDWFILKQIGNNMDPSFQKRLIKKIAKT